MKVTVFVKIVGKIDGKQLFELVEQFGMNVTDLMEETLVYGECYLEQASRVLYHCALFGNIMAEVTHQK
jgi:hypothetical protein